ncbi:MAG: glycerol-3-phosphate 1-O-acyltransferase [Desulfobacteraceae bacterium]|nr:MAG: glycerol-3-phosphate 1-O-acyltransferase [Desulfobacteraceae bacterium]
MPPVISTWNHFWIPFFVAAYLLGSIPFGRIISRRVAQMDITQRGSRNIGATNVAREIGLKWGVLTLVLDVSKGLLPTLLFRYVYPESHLGISLVGLCALLGHQFTPFLGFHGGKGVATALGFFMAVSPPATLLALSVFLITVYLWDFISLGSILASFSVPVFLALFGKPGTIILFSLFSAVLICLKHKDNLHRIAAGTERRWRKKRSKR